MADNLDSGPHKPHFTPPRPQDLDDSQYARDQECPEDDDETPVEEIEDIDWSDESEDFDSGMSVADIQEAYLKALQAEEAIEWPSGSRAESDAADELEAKSGTNTPDIPNADRIENSAFIPAVRHRAIPHDTTAVPTPRSARVDAATKSLESRQDASEPAVQSAANGAPNKPSEPPILNPTRIVEAILFVGGSPITSKRLCGVLGGNIDQTYVEQRIEELNVEYSSEGRPYEIRLGEGGYRMALKPEYESVRNKVYGAGPREVRLSQDTLEILALVAYQQPLSHADVEASGKKNAGNLVRQLIRRELVSITRVDSTRDGIRYHTTPRFLSLFGLASLTELPKADELSMR